jgi:Fe2+ or Zn2+ uptake regulation protein
LNKFKHNQTMKQIYQTPIRQLILDYFESNHYPTNLDQLNQYLQTKDLKCEFSTIFRQVKSMVKDGLLREFFLENKSKMYELAEVGDHFHYHIICNLCNQVFCGELKEQEFGGLKQILNIQKLNNISELELKVKGVCKDCSQK